VELALDLDGVQAWRELRSGELRVRALGVECRVREWTWGERRRLVEAALDGGRLDRERFVDGLVELVMEPVPPAELRSLFAHVALRLLGVRGGARPPSLVESERRLARELGWTPQMIDAQAAAAIDRLVGEVEPAEAEAPPGWTRIVVDDE
jgi:hypothetical protein